MIRCWKCLAITIVGIAATLVFSASIMFRKTPPQIALGSVVVLLAAIIVEKIHGRHS